MKRFSQACENNKQPILKVLERVFANSHRVLEIGSGSGQHAHYFSQTLSHIDWLTSDLAENHASINAWLDECAGDNFKRPLLLDVANPQHWNAVAHLAEIDACYSANTAHIMAWENVGKLFAGVVSVLPEKGLFSLYGPFNRAGQYTSEGNASFDRQLRSAAGDMGIRNDADVFTLANDVGMVLLEDVVMPANNRMLVFSRSGVTK